MADYETIPKEDAQLQPSKPKSLKFAATVAARGVGPDAIDATHG
jgi:hypothetical protein